MYVRMRVCVCVCILILVDSICGLIAVSIKLHNTQPIFHIRHAVSFEWQLFQLEIVASDCVPFGF